MENCPETRVLIQWLNGALRENEPSTIEKHIEKCDACQAKLLNLTDDFSLQPPSDPDSVLGDGDTFTNEPHFRSMRERLSRIVAKLQADANGPETRRDDQDGELKNLAVFSVQINDRETVEANAASTHNDGHSTELALADTLTTEPEAIRIDGFLLESHIGSGGFAHVFKAWEKRLARPVAIKLLDKNRIDARNRHRFLREAKAASSVQSPHVVQVFSSGETETGQPYIAMELVEGDTLAGWIAEKSKRKLGTEAIDHGAKLLAQVCRGVQAVHDADLIHRDIKPSNIFVDASSDSAKLGDFGLIRILGDDTVTLTRATELAGTPAYMSPEQTDPNGQIDATSDVYSLGATLYQTLTGQPPFRGSTVAILKQVNDLQPLPPRQLNEFVTRDLETICLKSLEKEPQRRYQSAAEMADDLQAAIDGRAIEARPVSSAGLLLRWAKRNRALATAVSLLFASLLLGAIASTTLWIRSDFHAKRSEANATIALANAAQAKANAAEATESRSQLVQSVKKLVSATFTRKSSYLALSGQDREKAVTQMSEIYQAIIDGQTAYDSDLMRELITDIAAATEVNLEMKNYDRAADLLKISLLPAEQLVTENGDTLENRTLAATVYNQFGEFLVNRTAKRQANKEGSAIWKVEATPDLQAPEAFEKVLEFAEVEAEPDSDIALQRMYANWNLILLEQPEKGNSQEDHSATVTASMFGMSQRMKSLRNENRELSANWMSIHQRMLLGLSKRHQGQESIDFRIERAKVFKDFIATLEGHGEETYWYDRSIAVNDFFIGMGYLRMGNATSAKPIILEAKDRLANLSAAYPRVIQFRADLAEALMVIANIDWNELSRESAMESFTKALNAFELCLKTDSGEIGLRRRIGHVYDTVGMRHLELENREAAIRCFQKGLLHTQIVLAAPYDSDLQGSDARMVEALEKKLEELAMEE